MIIPVGYLKTETLADRYGLTPYQVRNRLTDVRRVLFRGSNYYDPVSADIVLSGVPAEFSISLARLAEMLGTSRHTLRSRGVVERLMVLGHGVFLKTQYRFRSQALGPAREMIGEPLPADPDVEPRLYDCAQYRHCLDQASHRNAGMACRTCTRYVKSEKYLTAHW